MQREYWNDLAGPKWASAQVELDEILGPYADALRGSLSGLRKGASIVDVGCGCGATTLMASRQAPTAQITAMDVSAPMLDVARQRASLLQTDRLHFVLGDAASEAIEPESVDRIISRFGVMFFPEPERAFAHMRGWLKPQGRMVLMVWARRDQNPWMTEAMAALAKHIDMPPSDPDAPGPFSLGDPGKRKAVLSKAGLWIEEEAPIDTPMRVRGDIDTVTQFFTERGPAAVALQNAGAKAREAALTELRAMVEAKHDGRGCSFEALAVRLTLAADPNAKPLPEPGDDEATEG